MTREEAIRILDEVIPPPEHHTVDLDHLRIAQAWLCIKETLTAEPPKNVFVFRSEVFYKRDDIEVIRNIIKRQVEEGVVVLPRYLTLEAVTGPCTDVEVIIKQEAQP